MAADNNSHSTSRSLFAEAGIAVFAGLLFGVFYLWFQAPTLVGFLVSWAIGIIICSFILVVFRVFGTLEKRWLLLTFVLAGCLGGLAFWWFARPSVHPLVAVVLGGGYVSLLSVLEGAFGDAKTGTDP